DPLHLFARAQNFVGALLNATGDRGIGRSSVRRIVFESTIRGRVVRWRDDNSIGPSIFAAAVVRKNGVRNDRRWSVLIVLRDHQLNAVCGEHFDSTCKCGGGKRVRVDAEKQWTIDSLRR